MTDNSHKIILNPCGGTGAFSKPYADAGYDVRVITLPDYDVTKTIIFDNHLYFTGGNKEGMRIFCKDVYGFLAEPPCTEFSYAKSWTNSTRDFRSGFKIVNACMLIVHACLYGAWNNKNISSFKFWSLENPARGYLERFIGKPAMFWQPWEYGDPWTKQSALWGWFKSPVKTPVAIQSDNFAHDKFLQKLPKGYIKPPDMLNNRACRRAITPPGFAKAFFRANR